MCTKHVQNTYIALTRYPNRHNCNVMLQSVRRQPHIIKVASTAMQWLLPLPLPKFAMGGRAPIWLAGWLAGWLAENSRVRDFDKYVYISPPHIYIYIYTSVNPCISMHGAKWSRVQCNRVLWHSAQ